MKNEDREVTVLQTKVVPFYDPGKNRRTYSSTILERTIEILPKPSSTFTMNSSEEFEDDQ